MSEKKREASLRNLEKGREAKAAKNKQSKNIKGERRPPTAPSGRLIITSTPGAEVSHWMPKEEDEWMCPHCGMQFEHRDTGWAVSSAG